MICARRGRWTRPHARMCFFSLSTTAIPGPPKQAVSQCYGNTHSHSNKKKRFGFRCVSRGSSWQKKWWCSFFFLRAIEARIVRLLFINNALRACRNLPVCLERIKHWATQSAAETQCFILYNKQTKEAYTFWLNSPSPPADWVAQRFILYNKQTKEAYLVHLLAQFTLPPITFFGVFDQKPLISAWILLYMTLSLQVVRSFIPGSGTLHTYLRPSAGRAFFFCRSLLRLIPLFLRKRLFSEKSGKTTSLGFEPRTSFVCLQKKDEPLSHLVSADWNPVRPCGTERNGTRLFVVVRPVLATAVGGWYVIKKMFGYIHPCWTLGLATRHTANSIRTVTFSIYTPRNKSVFVHNSISASNGTITLCPFGRAVRSSHKQLNIFFRTRYTYIIDRK